MSIFAIGDLHLAMDPRVEKPMDIFGEEWVDHAEKLKTSWLQTVSPGDTVIICGDISWGLRLEEAQADFEWLRALPGKKLIFKGNHDLWWQSAGKLNRLYGDEDLIFVQNSACVVTADDGKKVAVCGSRGWICPGDEFFGQDDRKIYERELLRLEMSLEDGRASGAEEIIGVLHFRRQMTKSSFPDLLNFSADTGQRHAYTATCTGGRLFAKD